MFEYYDNSASAANAPSQRMVGSVTLQLCAPELLERFVSGLPHTRANEACLWRGACIGESFWVNFEVRR